MEVSINCASISNIHLVKEYANMEFITARGKQLSLEKRYPYLLDENNYENIHLLTKNGDIASILVVKTCLLNYENEEYRIFMVGIQVTIPNYRGYGFGRHLFEAVTSQYLTNGYDLGVGWTRLQSFYLRTGWVPYENGYFIQCWSPKVNENGRNVLLLRVGPDQYSKLDNYRIKHSSNHIIRNKNHGFEGWGTVYTPGEEGILFEIFESNAFVGYLYGVKTEDSFILYEIHMDDLTIFGNIVNEIARILGTHQFFINIGASDTRALGLLVSFTNVQINKPELGIYSYKDEKIFQKLRNFYIPFTDRI